MTVTSLEGVTHEDSLFFLSKVHASPFQLTRDSLLHEVVSLVMTLFFKQIYDQDSLFDDLFFNLVVWLIFS